MINKKQRLLINIIVLLPFAFFALFPIYSMLVLSFSSEKSLMAYPPKIIPGEYTLNAWRNVFTTRPVVKWLTNSIILTSLSTLISIVVAIFAGYSLSRYKNQFSIGIGYFFFATRMVPSTLIIIPLYILFQKWGIINKYPSVILAYISFQVPFASWMMKSFFDSIPTSLDEQAMVDGCTEIGALFRIILPLCPAGIMACILAASVLAWGDYMFARTFLSQNELLTITVGIKTFFQEYRFHWSEIMASCLLGTVPLIFLFLLFQKSLVKGLASGAVKQ